MHAYRHLQAEEQKIIWIYTEYIYKNKNDKICLRSEKFSQPQKGMWRQ